MTVAGDENHKEKKKKKEPEVVLDWWSKYYASLQDLEVITDRKLKAFKSTIIMHVAYEILMHPRKNDAASV